MTDLTRFTFYRGRVALYAALRVLGIGRGAHVAVQAFTCVAVPEAVLAVGAKPVFVDIEDTGVNMDAADLARKLTPQTKAIVIQHTFGVPAQIDALEAVAGQASIPMIEDCCHALDAKFMGRRVGSMGTAAFYSFEWGKPVVAGVGGSLVVNDTALLNGVALEYERFSPPSLPRCMRMEMQYLAHSLLYRPSWFWPVRRIYRLLAKLGVAEGNYNRINAEALSSDFFRKMSPRVKRRLTSKLAARNTGHSLALARKYDGMALPRSIRRVSVPEDCEPVFARYPLLAEGKQDLLRRAERERVELAQWYETPVHPIREPDYGSVGYVKGTCPVAERRCRQIVTLPVNMRTSDDFVSRVQRLLGSHG